MVARITVAAHAAENNVASAPVINRIRLISSWEVR